MPPGLRQYRDLFGAYLAAQRRGAFVLLALIVGNVGLSLAYPEILRMFLDRAASGATMHSLATLAVLYLVTAAISQAVSTAAIYTGEQLAWRITNRLRADLVLHCLRLEMPFHHEHTPGTLIERIDGDVTAVSNLFSQLTITIVSSTLLLAGIIALLFREDWRAGLPLLAFVVVAFLVLYRARRMAVAALTGERQAYAELYGFLEERLAGLDDIRANGGGGYVMRRFFEAHRRVYHRAVGASRASSTLFVTTSGVFAVGYVFMLAMGSYLFRQQVISLGTVYLIFQYTQLLRRPLDQITQQLREVQRAGAGIARVVALKQVPAPRDRGSQRLPNGPLSVEFDAVTFGYRAGSYVLNDVSFRLEPGEVLGLLGRTGSGKTTIGRLLLRLYEMSQGTVCLGGVNVATLRAADLRREIGVVTQDVQLFEASLRDNLTFFDSAIGDDRIAAALAEIGLRDWLALLPDGLDTRLGPAGTGLSAGQAQLVAFARVLLRDPRVVILDEASSRLDPATERLIERAMDRLLAGRTAIVIAHRLSTVARADRILVLEQGRVVEQGDRGALIDDVASRYSGLLRAGLAEVAV
ncbi:MAG: ABC transporter ATP-binding protein [Dehalococcoidia bacterium]